MTSMNVKSLPFDHHHHLSTDVRIVPYPELGVLYKLFLYKLFSVRNMSLSAYHDVAMSQSTHVIKTESLF
jgi:hypothetical protein